MPVDGLAAELSRRWQLPASAMRLETYSGLGSNRMTPRQLVRLLRELERTCADLGIAVEDVLPVVGCDPGTLKHFPLLEGMTGRLTAKTGTLTQPDGGVAALAGRLRTPDGDRWFSVVAPGTGTRLTRARRSQQAWLLERFDTPSSGVAECRSGVVHSDHDARVESPRPAVSPANR